MYYEQSDHEKKNRIIYFSNENIIKYQKKCYIFVIHLILRILTKMRERN